MKILAPPQSGSQGSLTSGRNRFGQYLRTRSIPVQPRTVAQQQRRNNMSALSAQWRELSTVLRTNWNDYADQIPVTDSLGQVNHLTGHQQFVGRGSLALLLGFASSAVAFAGNVPPALPTFRGAQLQGTVVSLLDDLTVTLNMTANDLADSVLELYSTPLVSAGRAFASVSNQLRLIAVIGSVPAVGDVPELAAPVFVDPIDIGTAFDGVFGALAAGTIYLATREVSNLQRGPFVPLRVEFAFE